MRGDKRTAIRVHGLSKRYRLGELDRYRTIRDAISDAVRFKKSARVRLDDDEIWALRDVSFDVSEGEVLGIIGANGAGKSTLLKILSRITEPTEGEAEIRGRVGSLLEVGTGFHNELTGRENVYLNGAILGMRRTEIDRRFDEIVDFSGVERFMDTPVKRYSTGMKVRLAFAVAAHLEPEILIIDEVLAVGDVEFQRKCLGKMGEVAGGGRTVLFVSHNLTAVRSLCSRAIRLDSGKLASDGNADSIVDAYLNGLRARGRAVVDLVAHPGRRKGSMSIMSEVSLPGGSPSIAMGEDLPISVAFRLADRRISPVLGVVIKDAGGIPILAVDNRFIGGYAFADEVSAGTITCTIPELRLVAGIYSYDLYLGDRHGSLDAVFDAGSFEVTAADVFHTGRLPPAGLGSVYWPARWILLNADEPIS